MVVGGSNLSVFFTANELGTTPATKLGATALYTMNRKIKTSLTRTTFTIDQNEDNPDLTSFLENYAPISSITPDTGEYEDGTKIIYWAANSTDSSKIIEDPFEAYKSFNNVGVSVVKHGKADVRIYCPDKYKVKKVFNKILERHFHYRIIFKDSGFLSPVMTVNIKC